MIRLEKIISAKTIIFFFLFLFVFLSSIFPIFDNDAWWHLKTGEYIVKNLSIPFHDIFSFTIQGKPWISFEWLSETIFYCTTFLFGLAGLTIFKALLVLLLFILLSKTSTDSNKYILWIILLLSFFAIRDGLRERPQIFAFLLIALYQLILRLEPSKKLYLIPALQVLWANLHGTSSFIGFGLVLIYLVFSNKYVIKTKVAVIAASFFALFINPHTYKIFSYLYVFFTQGFNNLILEYQSPQASLSFLPYFILAFFAIFAIMLDKKRAIEDVFVISISFIASLLAIRNIPVFVIMAAPIISDKLSQVARKNITIEKVGFGNNIVFAALFSALFLSGSWFFGQKIDFYKKYVFGVGDSHRSKQALEFMRTAKIKGPIFNDYDFGGHLIYSLYPQEKVFVDGRLVEYGSEFVKDSFYYFKPEVWAKLEAKYNFNCALIAQESYYPAKILDTDRSWVLVYWDDNALVYVKDIAQNKKLIKTFGYFFIKPNSPDQRYLKNVLRETVEKELNNSIYYAPASYRAKSLKALFEKNANKI